jgi:hypothetical protein
MENIVEYILNNLHLSNNELAALTGLTKDQVKWTIRKQGMRRTREQIGGIFAAKGTKQTGKNNPGWKGGISKNYYHYKVTQRQRNSLKVLARNRVYKAIKAGKLIKQPCQVCGDVNSQAHHTDYTKPLMVQWLCPFHHRETEKQTKQEFLTLGPLFSQAI